MIQYQRSPVRSRRCPATVDPFGDEPGRLALYLAKWPSKEGRFVRGPEFPMPRVLRLPAGRCRVNPGDPGGAGAADTSGQPSPAAAPYTGPGLATVNALISVGGGTNIFASLKQSWTSVSWEQVIKADPQCIIINDYGTPTAAQKEKFLETSRP